MALVEIQNGKILGEKKSGIYSFKAIPYAGPISGEMRWKPPLAKEPWSGVIDARSYSDVVPQFGGSQSILGGGARRVYRSAIGAPLNNSEGEDSLTLNIWTPSLDPNANLSVMVYIHGGGFSFGAANEIYDGTCLALSGVVIVAIQYRLGPLGFLHGGGLFDDDLLANNRGFLDQIAALRWVRDNISYFGGSPSSVTIFGESAGAFSVFNLCVSPMAVGLFKRAIAMSGMAEVCAPVEDYLELTLNALGEVGIRPGESHKLINMDRSTLNRLHKIVFRLAFRRKAEALYGEIGRRKINFMGAATGTEFLPISPLQAFREGGAGNIDLMVGTCANDGTLFSMMLPFGKTISSKIFMGHLVGFMPGGDVSSTEKFYRGCFPSDRYCDLYERINNDAFYRIPTIRVAAAHARNKTAKTYLYELNYKSPIAGLGAIHGIDIALLFQHSSSSLNKLISNDDGTHQLISQLREVWTNFAKTSQPIARGIPIWPVHESEDKIKMIFDRNSRLGSRSCHRIESFWSTMI